MVKGSLQGYDTGYGKASFKGFLQRSIGAALRVTLPLPLVCSREGEGHDKGWGKTVYLRAARLEGSMGFIGLTDECFRWSLGLRVLRV